MGLNEPLETRDRERLGIECPSPGLRMGADSSIPSAAAVVIAESHKIVFLHYLVGGSLFGTAESVSVPLKSLAFVPTWYSCGKCF
jgi:hypothetical protein